MLLGFVLVFSPHTLSANVHWGVAPTWANFALAIPVAMIAYTGIETVSNLAEEARDPRRSIPASIRLVAIAVFAIYFTLPLVALSALPVYKDAAGEYVTKLGLPPARGGYINDPVLGLVDNLDLHGFVLDAAQGLRRRARGDDPLHRRERRRDRRVADHVLDGELPAAARGVPAAAPALQDAVAGADRVRRRRSRSCSCSPGNVDFIGRMYAFGAMLSFTIAHFVGDPDAAQAAAGRGAVPHAPEPARPRRRLAAVRDPRRRRDRRRVARGGRAGRADAVRRARLARGGVRLLRDLPPAARDLRCARRRARRSCSGRRSRSSTATSSCRSSPGPSGQEAIDLAARLAAERGATIVALRVVVVPLDLPIDAELPEEEERADRLLDDARNQAELYGVRMIERLVRSRNAGRAIVEEAERRQSEIVVLGAPRAERKQIFGPTADYVLKHAPCRVMVAAGHEGGVSADRLPPTLTALARARDRSALGVAMIAVTPRHGGGQLGFLLGALFIAAGAGRLYLLRRRS